MLLYSFLACMALLPNFSFSHSVLIRTRLIASELHRLLRYRHSAYVQYASILCLANDEFALLEVVDFRICYFVNKKEVERGVLDVRRVKTDAFIP